METAQPFIIGVASIVCAIILLKVFFTLWRLLEKRVHPDKFEKLPSTPESAFRDLKGKAVLLHMKNGETIHDSKYRKTLFFSNGEFGCTLVYFELEKPDGTRIFVSGSDIMKIETNKNA